MSAPLSYRDGLEIPEDLRAASRHFAELGPRDRAELRRELRRLGHSHGEITEIIPVPRDTLAHWCRTSG